MVLQYIQCHQDSNYLVNLSLPRRPLGHSKPVGVSADCECSKQLVEGVAPEIRKATARHMAEIEGGFLGYSTSI